MRKPRSRWGNPSDLVSKEVYRPSFSKFQNIRSRASFHIVYRMGYNFLIGYLRRRNVIRVLLLISLTWVLYFTSLFLSLSISLSKIAPAIAIAHASINAALNVFTSKPVKKTAAILITIAVTNRRTIKVSRNKVTRFKGSLSKKPTVAFNNPITSATEIAVL